MRYLIVDGHSAIFAWPELRAKHGKRTGFARDELVRRLTGYQDATGIRVVAVFDGKGEKQNEATEPGGIQVFYSGAGQSADSIVERLCAKYGNQHDLTVVTEDHMEMQTAHTFGASVMSVAMMREALNDAERDLQKRLRKLKG